MGVAARTAKAPNLGHRQIFRLHGTYKRTHNTVWCVYMSRVLICPSYCDYTTGTNQSCCMPKIGKPALRVDELIDLRDFLTLHDCLHTFGPAVCLLASIDNGTSSCTSAMTQCFSNPEGWMALEFYGKGTISLLTVMMERDLNVTVVVALYLKVFRINLSATSLAC